MMTKKLNKKLGESSDGITSSLADKQANSSDIRDKVNEQNYKIDVLTDEIRRLNEQN